MAMFRTFRTMPKCNITVFAVSIGLFICFGLLIAEFLFQRDAIFKWYILPISTILFILLCWTFVKVYLSEPGSVPQFWAVQFKQQDISRERRYCLICHNFKPQRAHHCSGCGKCVLNMDHHCPWINNCVGFYNRKFFILFLLYLVANLAVALLTQIYIIVVELIPIFKGQSKTTVHTGIRMIVIIFQICVLFPIVTFSAYHLTLVFKNQTTLTEMKKQRQIQRGKTPDQNNVYDLGAYDNFTQVFGKHTWEWFFPITGTLSADGLSWPKNEYSKHLDKIKSLQNNNQSSLSTHRNNY